MKLKLFASALALATLGCFAPHPPLPHGMHHNHYPGYYAPGPRVYVPGPGYHAPHRRVYY